MFSKKNLKNKKVLITAGPTWVAIDKVRVITNIFGGALGSVIAKKAYDAGADVLLLMGPGRALLPKESDRFKIIKFKYYDELLKLMKKEVASKKYDIIIHSSAVSDYKPIISKEPKIKSGKKELIIRLKPTIKIVDLIKKIDPKVFLVKFKLEVNLTKKNLIEVAYKSMLQSNADLIVANDFKTVIKNHKAFIIDPNKNIITCDSKELIADRLIKIIAQKIHEKDRK